MKLAYLANADGDQTRLEAILLLLLERHDVDALVPVGEVADLLMATVSRRAGRLPLERGWTDPDFAGFVLQSVLGGVAVQPTAASEVARTNRLQSAVSVGMSDTHTLGGRRVAVVVGEAKAPVGAALIVTDSAQRGVDRTSDPPRVHPGHLGSNDIPPATCVLVEFVAGRFKVEFVDAAGEVVATETI